jgi:integrase
MKSQSQVKRIENQTAGLTFAAQAAKFLEKGANRKKKPMRQNTLKTYKSQIETHLLPLLGPVLLEDIANKAVKSVIEKLGAEKLSPATINLNLNIIKQIMASATNDEGDELFPRKWNSEHIDAPMIEDQKQPTVTSEAVQDAISKAEPIDKALYAVLASTGLRIAEALALRSGLDDGVGSFWAFGSKFIIRQQRNGNILGPVKTKAGNREVDISPELDHFLQCIVAVPDDGGLIFPESEATYRVRLEKNGIQGGFHCFRRFRATHLDSEGVPNGLQRFWTGHTSGDVHEGYIKSGEKIQLRKDWAAKAGLGFKLGAV